LPRIHSVICSEHITTDNLETLAELVLEFTLPLEGQIGWRDDKGSLYQSAYFELFDEKTRHDRFAGPWVVGQQEPDARELYEIVIDRFQLVRKWVDSGDGEREVGVVFVGKSETHRLDS
jgi:hypothetical protein